MEHDRPLELAFRIDLIASWIRHADAKAAVVLSAAAAVSAVAAVQLDDASLVARVAFAVTVVAAGVGGYRAWLALVPRTLPHESRKGSLVFFRSLAERESATDVLAALRGQAEDEVLLDFTHQLRELSLIANEKFKQVDKAISSVAGSMIALIIALIINACWRI